MTESYSGSLMFVYTTDSRYLAFCCISIASLAEHFEGATPDVTVFTHEIDRSTMLSAERFLGTIEANVRLIDVDPQWCRTMAAQLKRSPAQYAMLKFERFSKITTDRVVIIDGDTRVVSDASELLDADLKGAAIGAVDDLAVVAAGRVGTITRKLGLPDGSGYFNSGIMVVDVDRWSDGRIGESAVDILTNRQHILTYTDQCALNALMDDQWTRLPFRWNKLIGSVPADWPEAICHFAGTWKPWGLGAMGRTRFFRDLLGARHIEWYASMTRKTAAEGIGAGASPTGETSRTLLKLFGTSVTGRNAKMAARKGSRALQDFVVRRPELSR